MATSERMARRGLDLVLRRLIRHGRLEVAWPDASRTTYGSGGTPGAVAMRLADWGAVLGLLLDPALALGEGYMDGRIEPEGCDLYALLDLLVSNLAEGGDHPAHRWRAAARRLVRRVRQFNPAWRARRNVSHHYDLDTAFYERFLDPDLQYSCAFFATGAESLEAAQLAKQRRLAAKLLLTRPGLRVLDIGCGWGGLARRLAREHGAVVTGITLSVEQHAYATARAEAEGLAGRCRFELRDYRAVPAAQDYDRIVSVGMFEHVGVGHYDRFFRVVRGALAPDGVALLHTIGQSGPPADTNPWLTKYIFPGGYSPSLGEVMPPIERSGLIATDIEVLRLHYAMTIALWRARFAAERPWVRARFDERFCRMFEFYLAGCELAFRRERELNFQIQLARRRDAVPLTRGYLEAAG